MQYLLLVLLFCRKITWKFFFDLFCETSTQFKFSWNTVGYWVWKIQQISLLFDYCDLWYLCAGFVAVFDSRLLSISLIALNGVPWYAGAMRRLCWWGMTVERRKILRGMVRLTNYWSVKVHGCSHVESRGCCRESWHAVSMSNAFTTSVFNLIVKGSEFFEPTSR